MSMTIEEQVRTFAEEFVADLSPIDAAQIMAPAIAPTLEQRRRYRPRWVAIAAAVVVLILFLPFLWPNSSREPAEDRTSTTVAPTTSTAPPSTSILQISEALERQQLDATGRPGPVLGGANVGVINGQFVLVDPGLEDACISLGPCASEPEDGWYQDLDDDTTAYLWSSADGIEWSSEPLPGFLSNDWLWSQTVGDVMWIATEDATNRYANPTMWRRSAQSNWEQVSFTEPIDWGGMHRLLNWEPVVHESTVLILQGHEDRTGYWRSQDGGLNFAFVDDPLQLEGEEAFWHAGAWLLSWSEGFRALIDRGDQFETWESTDGLSWSLSASGFDLGRPRHSEFVSVAAAGLTEDGRFLFGHRPGIWVERELGSGIFEGVVVNADADLLYMVDTDWGYIVNGEGRWYASADGTVWEPLVYSDGTIGLEPRLVANGDLLLDSSLRFVLHFTGRDAGS